MSLVSLICEECETAYKFYRLNKKGGYEELADMWWGRYVAYAYLLEDKLGYKVKTHTDDGFTVIDNLTGETVYCN